MNLYVLAAGAERYTQPSAAPEQGNIVHTPGPVSGAPGLEATDL